MTTFRPLSTSGTIAALAIGIAALAAGARPAALLVLYFLSAVALSKLGAARKAQRTAGVLEKDGPRDAVQVLANGGVFAMLALSTTAAPASLRDALALAALGALAASEADTWATEIGTLVGHAPRSLFTLRRVPPGTSGGVTLAGSLAMVAGAAFVAAAASLLGIAVAVLAVTAGGVAGALADSALGATVQERRRCPRCDLATERLVHPCGTRTERAGGVRGLDNDAVNFLATVTGAAVAALLGASLHAR